MYLLTQSTKKHLSNELAKLDWKVEEQTETSKMILNDVSRSSYSSSRSPVDVFIFLQRHGIRVMIHLIC